jgi:UDP-N-acetylmuramyl pentapeptide phosphotransferase/UDP-N-acetylglucosamine-1-phosphate transferase
MMMMVVMIIIVTTIIITIIIIQVLDKKQITDRHRKEDKIQRIR